MRFGRSLRVRLDQVMGNEIPIFFLPVEPRSCTLNCDDVHQLIDVAYEARERSGLRTSISRNWWHLANLRKSTAARNSCAFDFLDETVACLDTASIVKAIQILAEVLAEASAGVPNLAATCTSDANEFFLRMESDDTSEADVSTEEILLRAF